MKRHLAPSRGSGDQQPAVDREHGAGDVGGEVGGQEQAALGDVLRGAEASHGHSGGSLARAVGGWGVTSE